MLTVSDKLLTEGILERMNYTPAPDGQSLIFTREDGKQVKVTYKDIQEYLKKNPQSKLGTALKAFGYSTGGGLVGAALGGLAGGAITAGNPAGVAVGAKIGMYPGILGGGLLGLRNHMVGIANATGADKIQRSYNK